MRVQPADAFCVVRNTRIVNLTPLNFGLSFLVRLGKYTYVMVSITETGRCTDRFSKTISPTQPSASLVTMHVEIHLNRGVPVSLIL